MLDFTPLAYPFFALLGAFVGFIINFVVWWFIPAGAWMMAVIAIGTVLGWLYACVVVK